MLICTRWRLFSHHSRQVVRTLPQRCWWCAEAGGVPCRCGRGGSSGPSVGVSRLISWNTAVVDGLVSTAASLLSADKQYCVALRRRRFWWHAEFTGYGGEGFVKLRIRRRTLAVATMHMGRLVPAGAFFVCAGDLLHAPFDLAERFCFSAGVRPSTWPLLGGFLLVAAWVRVP